jgi:hypothetical protein
MGVLLVAIVLVIAFAAGFMRPARADTVPQVKVKTNSALVCTWVPLLKVGLC